jgi:3-methyladenine DNA glycosylase AlkC
LRLVHLKGSLLVRWLVEARPATLLSQLLTWIQVDARPNKHMCRLCTQGEIPREPWFCLILVQKSNIHHVNETSAKKFFKKRKKVKTKIWIFQALDFIKNTLSNDQKHKPEHEKTKIEASKETLRYHLNHDHLNHEAILADSSTALPKTLKWKKC